METARKSLSKLLLVVEAEISTKEEGCFDKDQDNLYLKLFKKIKKKTYKLFYNSTIIFVQRQPSAEIAQIPISFNNFIGLGHLAAASLLFCIFLWRTKKN